MDTNKKEVPDSNPATPEYDKTFVELTEMIYGPGFLSQGGPKEIDEMFRGVNLNGLKMLDLGSGLGGPDFYLAKNNDVEIVGIDPQVGIIQQAQKKLNSLSKDLKGKVSFVVMADPTNLKQFADSTFDVVFCIESIMNVPSEIKIDYFKEICRVLKMSGKIIVLDWMHSPTYKKHGLPLHLLTTAEFQKVLEQAGFKNIKFNDTTLHRISAAQQNIDTVVAMEAEIKQRFGKETYENALKGWTFMKDAFEKRNLIVGFFRAEKL